MKKFVSLISMVFRLLLGFAVAWLVVQVSFTYLPFFGEESQRSRFAKIQPGKIHSNFEARLLVESIVTIIRNYYVDNHRTSPGSLIVSTLNTLADNSVLRVELDLQDLYKISYGEESVFIDIRNGYGKEKLIEDLLALSAAFDRWGLLGLKSEDGWFEVINILLASLDPHSSLLDEYAYKELRQGTDGSFGGLGVVVGVKDDLLTVIKPIPGSPAARAGIEKGDKILSINGVITFGETLEGLVEHMRGKVGSVVDLSIYKPGIYSPRNLSLSREIIQVGSVSSEKIDFKGKSILRLAIESFTSRTSFEVRKAIEESGVAGLGGIIIDLRSNPGGLLDQAVQVADIFLERGRIVSTKGRRLEIEKAGIGHLEVSQPLVVLINSESASASEIVAGALKDNNRAIIIGQPSFGKGSVQTIFELPDDQALKLTIARYYTPSGVSIQNTGIVPDIWLQPLLKFTDNKNLMGDARFRKEMSLEHSLDRGVRKDEIFYRLKGYYLSDEISISPQDNGIVGDFEMRFALKTLGEMIKASEVTKPRIHRASFLVNNRIDFIAKDLANETGRVTAWLKGRHDIDWKSSSGTTVDSNDLIFDLKLEDSGDVAQDSYINVGWDIKNLGSNSLERMSLYVTIENSFENAYEILIGGVAPMEKKSGSFRLPLNVASTVGSFQISGLLIQDGTPIIGTKKYLAMSSRRSPNITMDMKAVMVDESGGKYSNIIESGESFVIKVTITNSGDRECAGLTFNIVNLAGGQIRLGSVVQDVGLLAPNESKTLLIPAIAGQSLQSKKVVFGLKLSAENLQQPFVKSLSLVSRPSAMSARVQDRSIGH